MTIHGEADARPLRSLRRTSMTKALPLGVAAVLLLVGCSHKPDPKPVPTTTTTSTTVAPTTTKPKHVVLGRLTGAPLADPAVVDRPALVVKIDNADPEARPQLGINQADVVYEERVEGSVTRLAAVFQSKGANPIGPVRSARTTDVAIVSAFNRPLYAWSGANAAFARIIRSSPLVDVGYDATTTAYVRRGIGGKVAPHNLYASTTKLWAHAPGNSHPPPVLFTYRKPGGPIGAGAAPVRSAHVDFGVSRGAPADWRWDAKYHQFRRWQAGTPHKDEKGVQVAVPNVIIQFVTYRNTGFTDVSGNAVPEAVLVGTGECWVLTGGQIVKGTWSKPSPSAITTYADSTGKPIGLSPGRTWIELSSPGGATVKG